MIIALIIFTIWALGEIFTARHLTDNPDYTPLQTIAACFFWPIYWAREAIEQRKPYKVGNRVYFTGKTPSGLRDYSFIEHVGVDRLYGIVILELEHRVKVRIYDRLTMEPLPESYPEITDGWYFWAQELRHAWRRDIK